MEINWPLEVIIPGVPLSLAARAESRELWKERIRSAARPLLPEGHFASDAPVQVIIFYFSDTIVRFDVDNIVKPIFDAIKQFLIVDDRQVEKLVVQKFEPERLFSFTNPSEVLADAIEAQGPRMYLLVDASEPGEIS